MSFGTQVAQKQFWTDDLSDRTKFPNFREIISHTIHPDYDPSVTRDNAEEQRPANDIAIATIVDGAPSNFVPARVIAPMSTVTTDITIAGFGAFPDYDPLNPAPPKLRKVDTFIGTFLSQSKLIKDGPNPGKGSCVRDSGGSIYLRCNLTDTPILVGNVVSGPYDCNEGIGYNSDLRYYVPWIESTTGVSLTKVTLNTNCNNGVLDAGELCDSNVVDCSQLNAGYVDGTATCNTDCSGYDESSCITDLPENTCTESPCVASDLPLAIPDNRSSGITSEITVSDFEGAIDVVMVEVDIVHTYRGDLKLRLISPTGAETILHNRTGSGADNLNLSLSLDNYHSTDPIGQWMLIVSDHASQDRGSLTNWSLRFGQQAQTNCGNQIREGAEVCDGDEESCAALDISRFSGGTALCKSDCSGYDIATCSVIENNSTCVESPCTSDDSNLSIPDNSPSGVSSIITVESFNGQLTSVIVNVNIDHTYRGDLYVRLTSPQGTTTVLHNKTGGSADDLTISESLTDFQGEDPTGDFTLFVSDNASRDLGSLLSWSIQLH